MYAFGGGGCPGVVFRRLSGVVPTETVRLRITNVAKAVLVSGSPTRTPKDALNEFVSNAADEYAEAGIVLAASASGCGAAQQPYVAVDDDVRGMNADRLWELARPLFESAKVGDDRTLGEKAIGLLANRQLGGRCEIVTHNGRQRCGRRLCRRRRLSAVPPAGGRGAPLPRRTVRGRDRRGL
jgi:hypothetical protein